MTLALQHVFGVPGLIAFGRDVCLHWLFMVFRF